jgi:antitoxin (DNA-binding transcriptional repressor) of toxin-antitoxin stability system
MLNLCWTAQPSGERLEYYSYNSYMEKATVSKFKNNLSAYLRKVRAGAAVVIYERDVPVARVERIESSGSGADRLQLLSVEGVTRPPRHPLTVQTVRALLGNPLTRTSRILEALERDRAEDR